METVEVILLVCGVVVGSALCGIFSAIVHHKIENW